MVEDTDIVLVAIMKDPRDLEIARVLGWYRIPVRHAPWIRTGASVPNSAGPYPRRRACAGTNW
jgi:hypothetical protein